MTLAEHGSWGEPVKVTLTGHDTEVADDALSIVIVLVAEAEV